METKHHICEKCGHLWLIMPGYPNLKPTERKTNHCYCGEKLPI